MLTRHAKQRLQQRALPVLVVDLLCRYGAERKQNGSTVLYFERRSRKRAQRALKDALDRFEKIDDAFLVMAEDSGQIITAGHRTESLRHR